MKTEIPYLQKGDLIYIAAPAKAIEKEHVLYAKEFFEKQGYVVQISKHCLGQHHYFSGTEAERIIDFNEGLQNPDVKAIVCARGGYGCVQIVDQISWANFLLAPKWIVGFSDVTVFHQKIQTLNHQSIHGTMPLNFKENTQEALDSLLSALEGKSYTIKAKSHYKNKTGEAQGTLIGGNLSILYSLIGTDIQANYDNCILFIEDLAEQLYHLDRMFHSFRKAGILEKISGLIVGGMTDMKDTAIPFGQTLEEIILSHFQYRNLPIAFDFPAGHINNNHALKLGAKVKFRVDEHESSLIF